MSGSHPLQAYSPDDHRPLRGYALLTASFDAALMAFVAEHRRSGRELPARPSAADLALLAVATHKLSRLIARDRVTSFLRAPFTRDTGEAGRPRETRWAATLFSILAASDALHLAYVAAQEKVRAFA